MSIGLGTHTVFFFFCYFVHFIHFTHIDFQFKIIFSLSVSFVIFLFFGVCPKIKFYWFFPFSFGLVSIVFFIASCIFFLGRYTLFSLRYIEQCVFNRISSNKFFLDSKSVSYTFHLMSFIRSPTDNNGHTQAYVLPTHWDRERNDTKSITGSSMYMLFCGLGFIISRVFISFELYSLLFFKITSRYSDVNCI